MKFGLIVPDKKKKPSPSTTTATNTNSSKTASIFDEEDDEERELAALRRSKASAPPPPVSKSITTSDQFVERLHKEALNEDPNIFDYDAAVEMDDLKRKNIHRNSRYAGTVGKNDDERCLESKTEPKYMQNILAKAEERKIESELIKLRNMKRKAGSNEKSAGADEEEVFVTSAYKERLKELEEKEKDLKARQIREEDGDVTKRKDMTGFYYNLMKRNVSFGGKLSDETKRPKLVEVVASEAAGVSEDLIEVSEAKDSAIIETEPSEQIVFGPRRPPVNKK